MPVYGSQIKPKTVLRRLELQMMKPKNGDNNVQKKKMIQSLFISLFKHEERKKLIGFFTFSHLFKRF